MKFEVTFTKEKVVYVNALDKDDLMFKIEKYEKVLTKAHHTKRRIKATSTTPSASTN